MDVLNYVMVLVHPYHVVNSILHHFVHPILFNQMLNNYLLLFVHHWKNHQIVLTILLVYLDLLKNIHIRNLMLHIKIKVNFISVHDLNLFQVRDYVMTYIFIKYFDLLLQHVYVRMYHVKHLVHPYVH